jgi:Excalibur calcium-binding domain
VGIAAAVFQPSPPAAQALDYDCADFSSQAEAQEYLLPGDPYALDGDDDGVACEALPCPCASSTPEPPPPEPPEEAPLQIRAYVACGLSTYARPARECPHRSKVGAFFRSSRAATYTVCVKFPRKRRHCARGETEAETTYVNEIETSAVGWHKVTWLVEGRRVVRWFWRR